MLENTLLLAITTIVLFVLFQPHLKQSSYWRATVTPLASIIGSGFLVAAPLLSQAVNSWALFAMTAIVVFAYAIGSVIRYNIRYAEPLLYNGLTSTWLLAVERLASLVLCIAYVISIAFYLRLMASFILKTFEIESDFLANIITTAVLIFIATIGWWRGLTGLESLEETAVNIKLSIIAALLIGLAWFDISWLNQTGNELIYHPIEDWTYSLQLLAGVLLIIQGFETSRYLGAQYDADTRISSMRFAQILSAIIYLLFIALALPLLGDLNGRSGETAIIELSGIVASILPAMLIIAAVMSQFSAAIADTAGSGGLLSELSPRIAPKRGYLAVIALAIIIIWSASIFEIIAIASRAFALYYLLQCIVALLVARGQGHFIQQLGFSVIAGILLLVVIFAIPDGG